jgi:hypothetical protein
LPVPQAASAEEITRLNKELDEYKVCILSLSFSLACLRFSLKTKNKNLQKKLSKINEEHNALKNRFEALEKSTQDITAQLQASIKERLILDKHVLELSGKVFPPPSSPLYILTFIPKFEKEKTRANELAEKEKQLAVTRVEAQEAKDRVAALNSARRTLCQHNEALTKKYNY